VVTVDVRAMWRAGRLPVADGLYLGDGTAREVRLDPAAPGGLAVGPAFEPPADGSALIDTTVVPVPGGEVRAGEGSHGSDGWIALAGPDGELVWAVFLTEGNPVAAVEVTPADVTAVTTLGHRFTVPGGAVGAPRDAP
jgi:hypothetical protein